MIRDLGDIARHTFRPFSVDDVDITGALVPPGPPTIDPALTDDDGPYRPQPGPWQPTQQPIVIDLYCGEGGASVGYHRAGFHVIGVDKEPQPRYPFTFHQGDALTLLPHLVRQYRPAAVAASPTCQTRARVTAWRGKRTDHPDLLTPTLEALDDLGLPYVVENVPEAAWDGTMRPDYLLCGTQFGLNVRRHRVFQRGHWTGYELLPPCRCYRNRSLIPFEHKDERAFTDALGCHWMTNLGGRQAIPPAYTEHIGRQLLAALTPVEAVA